MDLIPKKALGDKWGDFVVNWNYKECKSRQVKRDKYDTHNYGNLQEFDANDDIY